VKDSRSIGRPSPRLTDRKHAKIDKRSAQADHFNPRRTHPATLSQLLVALPGMGGRVRRNTHALERKAAWSRQDYQPLRSHATCNTKSGAEGPGRGASEPSFSPL